MLPVIMKMQARSQDFCKGGYVGVHVWMYNHARLRGSGGMLRGSKIASEAILGQKQSRSSRACYMARGVLYPIFGCPCMHLLSQLTSNLHERKY